MGISCEINDKFKQKKKKSEYNVFAWHEHPHHEADIKTRADHQNSRVNHHCHSHTCWKKDCPRCRLAYKRHRAKRTYMTELVRDETTKKVKRKYAQDGDGNERIDPPATAALTEQEKIHPSTDPFSTPDSRVLGFGLKREDTFEQYQVEQNNLVSVCLQCNTSIQPLVTASQGKASMFY